MRYRANPYVKDTEGTYLPMYVPDLAVLYEIFVGKTFYEWGLNLTLGVHFTMNFTDPFPFSTLKQ